MTQRMNKTFYFIGIKGAGMAALAVLLKKMGNEVSGCDLAKHFFTEEELIKNHISIQTFEHYCIPNDATVIIGNAFLDDFEIVKKARENKLLTCYRYHEFLGKLMQNYISIGISGSHGKTTTTGMMAAIMTPQKGGYIIGDGTGYIEKDSRYLCVEADEYRRHFLSYFPNYAIITNIDLDHIDYFKSEADYNEAYESFLKQVFNKAVLCGDDAKTRALKVNVPHYYYGLSAHNDIQAQNIVETSYDVTFDYVFKGKSLYRFNLPFVGKHLLLNALAVISIAYFENISFEEIEHSLQHFTGVKRRFVVERFKNNIFVDDYAHHPTEIKITIEAAKKRFPNKKIVAVFKPHRVSRLYRFVEEFVEALSQADHVYLCDFTSIDDQEEGYNIDISYLSNRLPNAKVICEDDASATCLAKYDDVVYLFMSSKDIYPLAQLVKEKQKY